MLSDAVVDMIILAIWMPVIGAIVTPRITPLAAARPAIPGTNPMRGRPSEAIGRIPDDKVTGELMLFQEENDLLPAPAILATRRSLMAAPRHPNSLVSASRIVLANGITATR